MIADLDSRALVKAPLLTLGRPVVEERDEGFLGHDKRGEEILIPLLTYKLTSGRYNLHPTFKIVYTPFILDCAASMPIRPCRTSE